MRGNVDARLRVLFLVGIASGVFLLKSPLALAILCASQATLWLLVGLGPRRLARQVLKLWGFAAVILISFAITSEDPATDRWMRIGHGMLSVPINLGGLAAGGTMLLRVLTIIVASQVARVGDPRAIAAGLAALGAPRFFAVALDTVLALLGGGEGGGGGGGGGGGRGRGDGSGGGRRASRDTSEAAGPREGIIAAAKRIAKGDVGSIAARIERQIARAEAHMEHAEAPPLPGGDEAARTKGRATHRDIAIVAGLALTMLGIKALKILPSVPFAPGHKLVLLTPLYIAASLMTRHRFGATLTGLTMGVCAFLMGDGKYGVFEILKHVTPGLVCDALVPMMLAGGAKPGRLAWSIVGGASGAARFATIFVITLAVAPPAVAYAFWLPGIVIHTTFGIVSGYVSHPLVALLPRPPRLSESTTESELKEPV